MIKSATTINDIIKFEYDNKKYDIVIRNMINNSGFKYDDFDDVKQEVWMHIMDSNEKIIDIYNREKFLFWFIIVAKRQIRSKNSSTYYKLIKKSTIQDEYSESNHRIVVDNNLEEIIDNKEKLNKIIKVLDEYENNTIENKRNFFIFKMFYLYQLSVKEIVEITNIPRSAVYNYLRSSTKFIKTKLI